MLVQIRDGEPLHRNLLVRVLDQNIDVTLHSVGEEVEPGSMAVPPVVVVGSFREVISRRASSPEDLVNGLLLPVNRRGAVHESFERGHEDLIRLNVFRENELRVEVGFPRVVVTVGSVVGDERRVV